MVERTYWAGDGKHQIHADELQKRIPASGPVAQPRKNPALERFRKASNLYHEIFNNGCINGAHGMKAYFGEDGSYVKEMCHIRNWHVIHRIVEPRMDEIVMAAAVEQGLVEQEPTRLWVMALSGTSPLGSVTHVSPGDRLYPSAEECQRAIDEMVPAIGGPGRERYRPLPLIVA